MRHLLLTLAVLASGAAPAAEPSADALCVAVRDAVNRGTLSSLALAEAAVDPASIAGIGRLAGSDGRSEFSAVTAGNLHGDSRPELIGYLPTGGTCASTQVVWLDEALRTGRFDFEFQGYTAQETKDDEDLWLSWSGAEERLFRIQGETLVVAWSRHRGPGLVSRFDGGRRRPLCALSVVEEPTPPPAADSHHALCRAIASGELRALPWQADQSGTVSQPRPGYRGKVVARRSIDLDGDGRPEIIARNWPTNTPGCGAEPEWLTVLPAAPEGERALDAALAGVVFTGDPATYSRLYSVNETAYVYAGQYDEDQGLVVPVLYSLAASQLTPACRFQPRFRIKRRF